MIPWWTLNLVKQLYFDIGEKVGDLYLDVDQKSVNTISDQ